MGKRLVPVIPDGGWGWVVVVGSFLVHVFADGFVYSFGVLVKPLTDEFGVSDAYAATVISLLSGLTLGCGPIASAVTNKLGCRASVLIGSVIATVGCAITFFATEFIHIVITVGGIMGVGIGLMYCPAIVIVTMYFEKWRSLATGIAVSGAGIGTFIFPEIYGPITVKFGWRYTFLAGSVFMAACGICGLTFRPLEFVEKDDDEVEGSPVKSEASKESTEPTTKEDAALLAPPTEKLRATSHSEISKNSSNPSLKNGWKSTSDIEEGAQPRSRKATVTESSGYLTVKDVLYTGDVTARPEFQQNPDKFRSMTSLNHKAVDATDEVFESGKTSRLATIKKAFAGFLDLSLLLNGAFLLFAVSNLLTSVGFNSPLFFLPTHAEVMLGLTKEQGDRSLSVFGICNTVGRITFGLVGDRKLPLPFGLGENVPRNRLWLYIISLAICGCLTCMSYVFDSYLLLCIYAGAFGFSIASYICLTSVILVDLLGGLDQLTSAFGMLLLFQGVGTVFGPPVAGYIADITNKNYNWAFVFCGVNLLISGLVMVAAPCVKKDTGAISEEDRKKLALH